MTGAVTVAGLADALRRMQAGIDTIRDELNAADRALGDGDTGMTIASVVAAWNGALENVPADVASLLQQLARATRRASGSSLASVLGIGLTAAARQAADHRDSDSVALAAMLGAAIAAITERSGAAQGDKTLLDSLVAIRAAVASGSSSPLESAIDGAQRALDAFRGRETRIGRARMYGAKSVGHDDPGMLAALALLRAAARA